MERWTDGSSAQLSLHALPFYCFANSHSSSFLDLSWFTQCFDNFRQFVTTGLTTMDEMPCLYRTLAKCLMKTFWFWFRYSPIVITYRFYSISGGATLNWIFYQNLKKNNNFVRTSSWRVHTITKTKLVVKMDWSGSTIPKMEEPLTRLASTNPNPGHFPRTFPFSVPPPFLLEVRSILSIRSDVGKN